MGLSDSVSGQVNPLQGFPRPLLSKGFLEVYGTSSDADFRAYIDGSNTYGNLYLENAVAGATYHVFGMYIAK